MAGNWGVPAGLDGASLCGEDDDFVSTVSMLREMGQAKHMNGDYRGAYNDFRRAARMNPADQMVWEEYAKAFGDFQQQLVEDKDKASIATQASSSSAWEGQELSATYGSTYDSAMFQDFSGAVTTPQSASSGPSRKSASSRPRQHDELQAQAEAQARALPMSAASEEARERRQAWKSSKSHRFAYCVWLVVLVTVMYHYIDGYLDEETFEPLIPVITLWVVLITVVLLWRGGQHFAAPVTTTTKAFSAFALTVITTIHWASYWLPHVDPAPGPRPAPSPS